MYYVKQVHYEIQGGGRVDRRYIHFQNQTGITTKLQNNDSE